MAELGDLWWEYDVLGIDEGQFFADVSRKTRTSDFYDPPALYRLSNSVKMLHKPAKLSS